MTNKFKRAIAGVMAVATMATGMLTMNANAANTSNSNFSINITNSIKTANSNTRRLKTNSSSTYVNYTVKSNGTTATGPSKFVVYVFGSDGRTGTLVDKSSYDSSGNARKTAVVTKGTKGYVKQLVYESFGSNGFAQLYGSRYSTYSTGTAVGCWSPDSAAESGTVNYN